MFDRTFLPEALFEFVVMADTHYMLDPGERAVEFESRRQQTDRADYVLRQVADLEADFVVHLGDLVQEFPETDGFLQALQEALLQLKDCRVKPYHVAGNHDVGDKPDPTMPTAWVTPESLATHHEHFGRSWYSWDVQDCHFVVLNSQLLNSSLPDAEQQQIWLEEDLQRHQDRRLFLFLHLAPFLCFPQEPSLGHYDNIAPLARDWLLDLIRQYNVELLFSAHSHFAFYNRIDQTQHYGVMSTSFTRPGFSELFSSRPPSEQGRNDVDKLGFYLVRVYEADASIHFIRTGGRVGQAEQHLTDSTLLTNVSADVPTSPLGVTLAHPLAHTTDVPLAWPSMIRQPVRNDYPFLACLELGVQQVRVPITDLADRIQRDRLAMLRDEGCQVTAMWLSDEIDALFEDTQRYNPCFDDLEIQLPGSLYPDQQMLTELQFCQMELGVPIALNTIIPREKVGGKQHLRTRVGYLLEELADLNDHLAEADVELDRVVCHMDTDVSPWQIVDQVESLPILEQIGQLDWLLSFTTLNDAEQVNLATEALFSLARCPGSRLLFAPFLDLDRTMDVTQGLLDRMCNPRPVFHTIRTLNTILFSSPEIWQAIDVPSIRDCVSFGLKREGEMLWLLLPKAKLEEKIRLDLTSVWSGAEDYDQVYLINLTNSSVQPNSGDSPVVFNAPSLVRFTSGS